ncbi:MAG: glucokinase [Deltaproteobacteria bacterium]|nr:glucokinase [Deltaproteobacteria bacterium]
MRRGGAILAGDVGGTKTYLGLFIASGGKLKALDVRKYVNRDYPGLEGILEDFLPVIPCSGIRSAAFGIAGPVEDKRRRLTNIPWRIDEKSIRKKLGIKRLGLLNDLAAAAWGLQVIPKKDLVTIQKGSPQKGNAAFIAAGTGLGEAMLFWDGRRHIPGSSEGGHADFAACCPFEAELFSYLTDKFGHVSYERVLSGSGLENIYKFIKERSGREEPGRLKKRFKEAALDMASVISDEALKGGDMDCALALDTFVSIYGREAGNLALKAMAVGGVYVGGGIAPRILKALKSRRFTGAFADKGRFKGFLRRIPIYSVLNDKTALYGAARYALQLAGR